MGKSVHMHFRPNLNSNERLTCARVCEYGNENVIKIGNQKLKKVDKVKFLGIIIDDKLNWEPHIDHLAQNLKSSIIMIERIMKFTPNYEYNKTYDALFKPHLSYCISSWGREQSPTINYKVSFQSKKDGFAYYLRACLITLISRFFKKGIRHLNLC